MPIARNRKTVDNAAIEAFGAAAEARGSATSEPSTAAPAPAARPKRADTPAGDAPAPTAAEGPATAIVRWKGHEDLRDEIKTYSKSERYSEQSIMLRAMRLGFEQIRRDGM